MTFAWIAFQLLLVHNADCQQLQTPNKSCLDYLRSGFKTNGYYSIIDQTGNSLTAYCDFESEPGSAWTLVMSWSLQNNNLSAFKVATLTENAVVNEKTPNWNAYRQSKNAMSFLKSQSSHWRATCSFNKVKFDYRDYVRGSFKNFDITTFLGYGLCKKVEYIDIRGHIGCNTMVAFWQLKGHNMLHVDSAADLCLYDGTSGAVSSEDNFGLYRYTNNKFRCTTDPSATTQYWFGGYV